MAGCGDEKPREEPWWGAHAHRDPANGYQISHPPEWKVERRSDPDHTVAIITVPGDPDARIFIRMQETDATQLPPAEDFAATFGKGMEGFQKHKVEKTTCNLIPAIRLKFSRGRGEAVKTSLTFVLLHEKRLYMVLAFAPKDSFAKYEDKFDSIGYSFSPCAE